MTTTQQSLREVSVEFSSRYLLEWVLFETNQEEAKRLAPRVRSIAERIYNLQVEYFNADYGKRNEIRKFVTDNYLTTHSIEMFSNAAKSDAVGLDFIDHILTYLSKMTQADYIPGSELTADPIPHTVVCPSPSGIAFLNIVNKKLKD
jgi:hypothetical protein